MAQRSGKPYILAWLALLVLTGASYGLHLLPLGSFSPVAAFSIALAKALIVILVFMHLTEAAFSVRMVALLNLLFVALLCLGVVADVALR